MAFEAKAHLQRLRLIDEASSRLDPPGDTRPQPTSRRHVDGVVEVDEVREVVRPCSRRSAAPVRKALPSPGASIGASFQMSYVAVL